MTAGMKSSEFMIALAALLVGTALMVVGALKSQPALIEHGKWLAMTATGGYSLARGLAKFGLGAFASGAEAAEPPADDKAAATAVANIK